MKRLVYMTLILAGLFCSACVETFEEHYGLEINSEKYSVPAEEYALPVTVYCSGKWTASLETDPVWADLDQAVGEGITTIHLNCDANTGLSRAVNLILQSEGKEKRIRIVQKGGIVEPELLFLSDEQDLANGSYKVFTAFETNIPDELLQEVLPTVSYASDEEDWITDVSFQTDDQEAGETDIPMAHRGLVVFSIKPNATGEKRTATIGFSIADANDLVYGDSFTVTQQAEDTYIALEGDVVPIEGGHRTVVFTTNISPVIPEMSVEVKYEDSSLAGFISNVKLNQQELSYDIQENTSGVKRRATIIVTYTDLEGVTYSASASITQRTVAQPRELSFADLRTLFMDTDIPYPGNDDYIDYIVCQVIGDTANPNMDQNINEGPNKITTDENDRTNYVQSMDGQYGFRLKFKSAEDNIYQRGQQIKILLSDVVLSRENDPMRYTLRDVKADDVELITEGSAGAIQPKARTIATLTDDDIYTYCELSDLEFAVKQGAYTNVREYDAIENPYNRGVALSGGTQAQKAKDGAANLLYDNMNDAIYMLVNMNCAWRRTGKTVPQGVGSVKGIIVHTPMERWGGQLGRYSIRPIDESDIGIATTSASNYSILAEWAVNKQTISIGAYKWNDNGSYVVGNSTNSADQLVQNKMHATTDNVGGSARLYSENRMLNQNKTADIGYPIALVNGYSGLNVSNYTPGDGLSFGMSKYSVLAFYGNIAGWYDWDDGRWTGKTNGIVMELSTANVSGSSAALNFSIAAGRHGSGEAYCSWTNNHSFPVYWKVEYAISTDNGQTWSDYTEAMNAATGTPGFEMRSLPWCINGNKTYLSVFEATTQETWTPSDAGFGLVPYRFILPGEILGQSRVRIRITPSSDIIASWNSGLVNYNKGQTYKNMRMTHDYSVNIAGAVYLEDVVIQYK